ncbi:hypothetical protein NPIL_373281, partial [Nephila pilipes]
NTLVVLILNFQNVNSREESSFRIEDPGDRGIIMGIDHFLGRPSSSSRISNCRADAKIDPDQRKAQ